MAMLAVLNNLSYPSVTEPTPPPADAATAIDHLVATLRALRRGREDLALVSEDSLPSLIARLSPTWQPDRRNHDKRLFLKRLATKAPFSTVLTKDQQDFVDYTWQGQRATGLGTAHLVDGLAVSLTLDACWGEASVTIGRCLLQETDDGELGMVDDIVVVPHASTPAHVEHHGSWLRDRGLRDVHTGAAVWAEREALFPSLRFLPSVEEQLTALDLRWLHTVKGLLAGFQRAVSSWQDVGTKPTPIWPVKVTPEGEQRRALCWFHDPLTNNRELFDTHARFTPGPGRMHFRWDPSARQVVIAYIGRKLGA